MKEKFGKIKDVIITGALVVVPVAVIVVVLADVIRKLIRITEPITDYMDFGIPLIKSIVATLLILIAILLVFLFCGILLQTYLGNSFNSWVERKIFDRIPFFQTLKRVVSQITGVEKDTYKVVEVQLDNGLSILGIHTETLSDKRCLVYCPHAPLINIGQLYTVSEDRITPTGIKIKDFTDVITKIGLDADKILKS